MVVVVDWLQGLANDGVIFTGRWPTLYLTGSALNHEGYMTTPFFGNPLDSIPFEMKTFTANTHILTD